jgi:AraC-like DNA-binding protein
MLAERKSNSEIARELGVTGATARRHTERLLLKLGVSRRAAVRHTLIQRIGGGCTGLARAVCSEERASAGNRLGERAQSRGACQTALALSRADDVGECTSESRRGRPKKRTVRRRGLKESIVVLLAREHERQLVRDALAGEVRVHFAEGPRDVHPPWRNEAPIAVLVELHEEREHRMERALGILRREAPSIPRWAWIELVPASVHMAMRLATRGLIAAAITSGDDPGRRLRELLKNARALSESEALSKVWGEWARPETQVILEACIAASATATTVRDVQHQLNKSLRTLNRELSAQGLPSLARILAFCRLLRAMYRLDHRDIKVKAVASGLGYKYPSALSHQLHWFTGLSIASLPAGSRFATIAALLSADLSAKRSQTHAGKDRDAASRQRRQPKRGTHGSGMREMSATI